jgi:MFS family permease
MHLSDRNLTNRITIAGLFIWFLAALFFSYEFFLRTILGSLVYEVLHSLKITTEQLSLIDVAYCITYGIMQIPVGILVDRYGARRMLILSVTVCSIGVILFGFATGFYFAFFCRLLMGFGSSFAFICLLVLTLNWLPKRTHGLFFGLSQLLGAIGPMLAGAPLILLLHATHDKWRLILFGVGLAGFLLLLLIILFVRNSPRGVMPKKAVKLSGETLIKLKRLFKDKNVWRLVIYSASIYASLALLGTLWGITDLETRHMMPSAAAFVVSLLWFGLAFGAPMLGVISDFINHRKPVLFFCSILGILVSLLIIFLPGNNLWLFAILFFGLGVASAGQSVAFVIIAENVGDDLKATALGLNNAGISFTIALVVVIVGFIIQRSSGVDIHLFQQSDFRLGLLVMPALYVISLLILIF